MRSSISVCHKHTPWRLAGAVLCLGVLRVRPVASRPLLQIRAVTVQLVAVDVLTQALLAAAERARLLPADLRRARACGPVRVQPLLPRCALGRDGEGAADRVSQVSGELSELHADQGNGQCPKMEITTTARTTTMSTAASGQPSLSIRTTRRAAARSCIRTSRSGG